VTSSNHAARTAPYYHAVGIGAGPANLSLAALFEAATAEKIALFDRQPGPAWHPTLLQPGVRMQTSWLKDLVSLVDPRHRLTFLNYLVTTGRLFALLNAQFDVIPRQEYQRYLAWAAGQLENVTYGVSVDRVSFGAGGFTVHAGARVLARSEHLVIGVGSRSVVPEGFAGLPPQRSFIADSLGDRIDDVAAEPDAPVAVVGGGQTGLECVLTLLRRGCTDITWFGRHQWFETIDDSPVANDFYRPAYQRFLQGLSAPTRRRLIEEQRPTADALTPGGLRVLYQANYDGMLALGRFPVTLRPGRDVTRGELAGDHVLLHVTGLEGHETFRARHTVIATGRRLTPIPFDEDLWDRVEVDDEGELVLEPDYSVRWKGMNGHKIFALNRGRFSHGIPDANLTLLPVRAATVLNAMFGRELFRVSDELCPIEWGTAA
jgi:lysine N6-hydroxylase